MAYKFKLCPESLKREFSVYIVIAKGKNNIKIYVGKTGDNREISKPYLLEIIPRLVTLSLRTLEVRDEIEGAG